MSLLLPFIIITRPNTIVATVVESKRLRKTLSPFAVSLPIVARYLSGYEFIA